MNLVGDRLAQHAAEAMLDKKAENVQILDMRGVIVDADFFVIGGCSSMSQIRAVSESVIASLEEAGVQAHHLEGRRNNKWVLLDYGDVIVHIFLNEEREYYNLEKLWADAKRLPVDSV